MQVYLWVIVLGLKTFQGDSAVIYLYAVCVCFSVAYVIAGCLPRWERACHLAFHVRIKKYENFVLTA